MGIKDRTLVILVGALLMVLILIAICFYAGPYSSPKVLESSNFSSRNGSATSQFSDAIDIALNGSEMGSMVLDNPENYNIGNVSTMSGGYNGNTGYTNVTDMLVQVPFTFNAGAMAQYYLVYVDLTKRTVIGTEYADAHHTPAYVQVNIPPGTSWYHDLGHGLTGHGEIITRNSSPIIISTVGFRETYNNNSSMIMPEILDSENFQKAMNGEAYQTINVSLNVTPEQNTVTGSINTSEDLIMLINNEEKNNLNTTIWFF